MNVASCALYALCMAGGLWGAPPLFVDRYDYSIGSALATVDVNGDGIEDIVSANANSVSVIFGIGNGRFRSGPSSNVSFQPSSVVAADIDNDGIVDLIMVGGTGQSLGCCVGVSFGNGDGTFQAAVQYTSGAGGNILGQATGDFNGDGILDVAAIGPSGIWLYTGKGGGSLNAPSFISLANLQSSPMIIVAADVNRDGRLDLVASTSNGFCILLGDGDGSFQAGINVTSPFPGPPTGMTVGDLNGDGLPDVVLVSNQYTSSLTYFAEGNGSFGQPKSVDLPGNDQVAIADINGDGIPDLVSDGVYVALGKGGGTFKTPIYYPVSSPSLDGADLVVPAFLRKPGLVDLVVTNQFGGISVLLNNGKGVFQEGIRAPISGGVAGCSGTADFNGDGIQDLAVGVSAGVSILFGTGKASSPFLQGPVTDVAGMLCLNVADLNDDGVPDLLITASPNQVIGLIGKGDGTFTPVPPSTVSSIGYIAVGDFDGDGKIDFAMNSNLYALGNGDGTFQAAKQIVSNPPLAGFSGVAAGDLNGDGKADLLLSNGTNSTTYVLISNGAGFTLTQTLDTYDACYFAYEPVIAFLTKSGIPDVLFACGDSGTPIYVNNGKGRLTYQETLETLIFSGGTFPVVADLNGDGVADIAAQTGYDITIFVGEGNLTYAQEFSYLGLNSGPVGVFPMSLHGQSPTSGMPDLAVPNQGGTVQVLLNTTK